jgi:hypothetical protein
MRIANTRVSGVARLLLAGAALISMNAEATDRTSLRVEKKTQVSSPAARGAVEVTYTLLNTSTKTITSWDFTCVTVNHAGLSATTSIAQDGYRSHALSQLLGSAPPESGGIIRPGERIVQTATLLPGELDGPLAAKSCAPVLVIFDDATFEGDSTLANERFDARAAEAIAALKAVKELTNALQSGKAPVAAMDRAIETREDGAARDLLIAVRDFVQDGAAIGTTDLLKTLEARYLAAFAHLPEQWRARVEKEMEP